MSLYVHGSIRDGFVVSRTPFSGSTTRQTEVVVEEPPELPALPTASVTADSVAITKSKCGYTSPLLDEVGNVRPRPIPERVYHTKTWDCNGITGEEIDGPCPSAREVLTDNCQHLGVTRHNVVVTDTSIDYTSDPEGLHHFTTTISDEYTTATLISEALADLPAFDNVWGDTVSASRNLPEHEMSYSIRRMRYKIVLSSPAAATIRVNWKERFTPTAGGVVDTAKSTFIPVGLSETNVVTRNEPSTNGTYTVVDISLAYV